MSRWSIPPSLEGKVAGKVRTLLLGAFYWNAITEVLLQGPEAQILPCQGGWGLVRPN